MPSYFASQIYFLQTKIVLENIEKVSLSKGFTEDCQFTKHSGNKFQK